MRTHPRRSVPLAVVVSLGVIACLVPGCGTSGHGAVEASRGRSDGPTYPARGQFGASDGVGAMVFSGPDLDARTRVAGAKTE